MTKVVLRAILTPTAIKAINAVRSFFSESILLTIAKNNMHANNLNTSAALVHRSTEAYKLNIELMSRNRIGRSTGPATAKLPITIFRQIQRKRRKRIAQKDRGRGNLLEKNKISKGKHKKNTSYW